MPPNSQYLAVPGDQVRDVPCSGGAEEVDGILVTGCWSSHSRLDDLRNLLDGNAGFRGHRSPHELLQNVLQFFEKHRTCDELQRSGTCQGEKLPRRAAV